MSLELNNHLNLGKTKAIPWPIPLRAAPPPLGLQPHWQEGTRWNPWANQGSDQCLHSQTSFIVPPPPPPAIIPSDGHSDTQEMPFLPLMAIQLSPGCCKGDVKVWGNSVSAQKWTRCDKRKCLLGNWESCRNVGGLFTSPANVVILFLKLVHSLCMSVMISFVKCATHFGVIL